MGSRIQLALATYAFGALGIFLLVSPWSPFWDQATLPFTPTAVGPILRSGWLRGAVSGLGGWNLFVAAQTGAALWRTFREPGERTG